MNDRSTTARDAGATRPRRVTSYDVARAAGVAQSTVSRCLRDASSISPETRDRVREVAARLGYTRNSLARSLITRRSNMVGVIATKFTIQNNPELVFAIGDALKASGNGLLLMVIENDGRIGDALPDALEYPLDGLISCAVMSPGEAERFTQRGVPIVFFNRYVEAEQTDCVATDHERAGAEVADVLIRAGHRSIVCVKGPHEAPVSRLRVDAFVARLAAHGIGEVPTRSTDFSYAGGRDAFLGMVEGRPRPDAVFCANDQLAFGVIDACRHALGWSVPGDISVIGFDDIAEAGRPSYELTTVRQPIVEMARTAVAFLLERIVRPDLAARRLLVPGDLIARRSARLARA